jgi:hypothetical protein
MPGSDALSAPAHPLASVARAFLHRKPLTAPDGSISTYGYDTQNRMNGLANLWAGSFGGSRLLRGLAELDRPVVRGVVVRKDCHP